MQAKELEVKETVIEMITRDPYNYACMTGALSALLTMVETQLIVARKYNKSISRKELARIVARYHAFEAAQKSAQAEQKRINDATLKI